MARLQKFSGTRNLPGVGSPQVVADTAVGAATESFGQQVSRSAGEFGSLAETALKHKQKTAQPADQSGDLDLAVRKRQQQIDDFEAHQIGRQLRSFLNSKAMEERQRQRPGGAGYTEAMLAHLEKGREKALEELPESARARFQQEFDAERDQYAGSFAAVEAAENEKYFQRGLAEEENQLAAEVRENPLRFDEAYRHAATVLKSAPLPARVKEDAYRRMSGKITEAWLGTRPVDEQISALDAELARRAGGQVPPAAKGTGKAGKLHGTAKKTETVPGEDGETAGRLQMLPDVDLKRLHAGALKKKATASAAEAERIAGRIDAAHGLFEAKEIETNSVLEPHQKLHLLNRLTQAAEEQSMNAKAVDWINSAEAGEAMLPGHRELADRAFVYLDDGETDRDALARGILRAKGVLPKTYVKSLRKGLESRDPQEVGRAYENLTAVAGDGLSADAHGLDTDKLQAAQARWSFLRERHGLTSREAAMRLADANNPERRKDLLAEWDAQHSQHGGGFTETGGLLERLGAGGRTEAIFRRQESPN